jgi:hypothetical protein
MALPQRLLLALCVLGVVFTASAVSTQCLTVAAAASDG